MPRRANNGLPTSSSRGSSSGRLFVGQHVAVQVEADAEMFGQAIGPVERADGIAAGNQQDPAAIGAVECFEEILFGGQALVPLSRRRWAAPGWPFHLAR